MFYHSVMSLDERAGIKSGDLGYKRMLQDF